MQDVTMATRRIMLVTAGALGWTAVRAIITASADLTLVGETDQIERAVDLAGTCQPDAIIAATEVDGTSTLPLLTELRAKLPAATLALIGWRAEQRQLLHLSDAGICGFLVWDELRTTEIIEVVVRAAVQGKLVVLSEAAARALVTAKRQRLTGVIDVPHLTDRQRSIFRYLAEGLTVEQIAHLGDCSASTVKREIQAIEEALDARDRLVLGMKGALLGLIP
jgi:DNA-binding NarL/FixJ family response regulator